MQKSRSTRGHCFEGGPLTKFGFPLEIQPTAGEKASFNDASYIEAGAFILQHEQVLDDADILTRIHPPTSEMAPRLAGKTLVSMIQPAINTDLYHQLAEQKTNVLALDCVPRMLSRGQAFDILSSQANIAGYRSVIEAAQTFPRFFAGQMTAAGKVPPAKVLVLGAGVAGLAAVQTAKNMGAIVSNLSRQSSLNLYQRGIHVSFSLASIDT